MNFRLLLRGGLFAIVGLVAVLSTLVQSAAAMFAWPWCLGYGLFCVAPWLVLVLSWADSAHTWTLPNARWCVIEVVWLVSVMVGLVFSPFNGQEIAVWTGVPLVLAGLALLVSDLCTDSLRQRWLACAIGGIGAALSVISVSLWVSDQIMRWQLADAAGASLPQGLGTGWRWWLEGRNSQPLGHFNYTAGSALLFLPWLLWLSWCSPGWKRLGWGLGALACMVMGISSGSRGGLLGLVIAILLSSWLLVQHRRSRRLRGLVSLTFVVVLTLAFLHPVVRHGFQPARKSQSPNLSNAERKGMMSVGWRAGLDRPWTGWGAGSVPLFYDRYRGQENFGAINMLQVHNTPLNLWAEGGLPMVLAAAALCGLAACTIWQASRRRELSPDTLLWPAAVSLGGYAIFSLTDYQLDLPTIAFVVAANFGVIAHASSGSEMPMQMRKGGWVLSLFVLIAVTLCFVPWVAARRALNAGQLDLAISWLPRDNALLIIRGLNNAEASRNEEDRLKKGLYVEAAKKDLYAAMAGGAHQEIAHFNLGWLELPSNPASARKHFAAVLAIAPNRNDAWFGLALASLAMKDEAVAIDSLAMEALSQPSFLSSGWWTVPDLSKRRADVMGIMLVKLRGIMAGTSPGCWPEPQARYYAAMLGWLLHEVPLDHVVEAAEKLGQKQIWLKALTSDRSTLQADYVRLSEGWRKIAEWVPTPEQLIGQLKARAALSPEEFLRVALYPTSEKAHVMASIYSRREGFAIRMRNPYARFSRDCAQQLRSPLADIFVDGLMLPPGWIFDQELRGLAAPVTLALINAAR